MDETGLFYNLLPNRSYVKVEHHKNARGLKLVKAKDRVTLFIATNATGNNKVPLCLIGKSLKPICFKHGPPCLKYFSQAKAWSDSKVFKQWWEFFLNHIRMKTAEKVLLIMDNCGPHGSEITDPQNQVKVVFLPPNVTSMYQPMDSRVIAMVKKNYRYCLLRMILETFEERQVLHETAKRAKMGAGTMGLNEGHTPHLKDMMDILYTVWDEKPASKIKICWKKSTLVSFTQPVSTVIDNTPINHQDEEIVVDTVDMEESNDGNGEEFSGGADFVLKMVELARKFASNSGSVLDDKNELDAVVKEMVQTINETNGDQN